MTNLSPASKSHWLTRERLLIGAPFLAGLLIAAAIAWLLVRPAVQRVQALDERRVQLEQLKRGLPALDQRIKLASDNLRQAEQKQILLVGLIAGSSTVQTFLALLDQQAQASGVTIQRYEPLPEPVSPPARASQGGQRDKEASDQKPQDPLVELGYQRSAVALQVSGPYQGLQEFMRRMEGLQLLVKSSDLALDAVAIKDRDNPQQSVARTELSLELSFYDLKPEQPKQADDMPEEQAPS